MSTRHAACPAISRLAYTYPLVCVAVWLNYVVFTIRQQCHWGLKIVWLAIFCKQLDDIHDFEVKSQPMAHFYLHRLTRFVHDYNILNLHASLFWQYFHQSEDHVVSHVCGKFRSYRLRSISAGYIQLPRYRHQPNSRVSIIICQQCWTVCRLFWTTI